MLDPGIGTGFGNLRSSHPDEVEENDFVLAVSENSVGQVAASSGGPSEPALAGAPSAVEDVIWVSRLALEFVEYAAGKEDFEMSVEHVMLTFVQEIGFDGLEHAVPLDLRGLRRPGEMLQSMVERIGPRDAGRRLAHMSPNF